MKRYLIKKKKKIARKFSISHDAVSGTGYRSIKICIQIVAFVRKIGFDLLNFVSLSIGWPINLPLVWIFLIGFFEFRITNRLPAEKGAGGFYQLNGLSWESGVGWTTIQQRGMEIFCCYCCWIDWKIKQLVAFNHESKVSVCLFSTKLYKRVKQKKNLSFELSSLSANFDKFSEITRMFPKQIDTN